ncbi:hypothetical protein H1Q78_11200 [Cellulosimicrobium cellulans]|nr:hypothetical protein [Cellulosimicrobium cellulans]UKJ62378.1 hypothetical protein H1Q78_11200 [Cellulosimicrobium cellulans]
MYERATAARARLGPHGGEQRLARGRVRGESREGVGPRVVGDGVQVRDREDVAHVRLGAEGRREVREVAAPVGQPPLRPVRVQVRLVVGRRGREHVAHAQHPEPGGRPHRAQHRLAPAVDDRGIDEVERAERVRGPGPGQRAAPNGRAVTVGRRDGQLAPPERQPHPRRVRRVAYRRRDQREQPLDVRGGVVALLRRVRRREDALADGSVGEHRPQVGHARPEAFQQRVRRTRVDDAQPEVGRVAGVEHPAAGVRRLAPPGVQEEKAAGPADDLPAEQRDRQRTQCLEHRPVGGVRREGLVQRPPARRVGGEREVVHHVREAHDPRPERPCDRAERTRDVHQVRDPELRPHAGVAHVAREDARLGGRDQGVPDGVGRVVVVRPGWLLGTPRGRRVEREERGPGELRLGRRPHLRVDRARRQPGRDEGQHVGAARPREPSEQLRVRPPRRARDVRGDRTGRDVPARRVQREGRQEERGERETLVGGGRRVQDVGARTVAGQRPRDRPPRRRTLLDRAVGEQGRVDRPLPAQDGPPVGDVGDPALLDAVPGHDDLGERGEREQQRVVHSGELRADGGEGVGVAQLDLDDRVVARRHLDAGRERETQHREPVGPARHLGGEVGTVGDHVVERGARAGERQLDRTLPRPDPHPVGDRADGREADPEPADRGRPSDGVARTLPRRGRAQRHERRDARRVQRLAGVRRAQHPGPVRSRRRVQAQAQPPRDPGPGRRVRGVLRELDDDPPPVRPVGVVLLGVRVLAQTRRRRPPRLQDRAAQGGRPEDVVRHSCGSSAAGSAVG